MEEKKEEKKEEAKPTQITVKLADGEKVLSADDIVKLVASHTELTEKASPFLKTIEKYEVEPELYLRQSESALSVIQQLISEGVIDNQGKPIKAAPKKEGKEDDSLNLDRLLKSDKVDPKDLTADARTAAIVKKAIEPLQAALKDSREVQNRLVKIDIRDNLMRTFPDLSVDEAEEVMVHALEDQTKGLKAHAEGFVNRKREKKSQERKAFAQEFGINLEEWEQKHKLKEEATKSGDTFGLRTSLKGKKVSWRGDKDSLTPRQAVMAFFKGGS